MELAQLTYFVAVVEERSFTRGAARAQVVQSAASAAVARLERSLGVELLERGGREVRPTAAGSAVYRRALTLLGTVQDIRDEVVAVREGLSGLVSIGVVYSTGDVDLPDVVRRFRRGHPGVEVRVVPVPGAAETRVEAVRDGTLDLALVPPTRPLPDTVRFTPVTRARLALVCRPDDELAARPAVPLRDVAERPFVDFPRGWGNRGLVDEHVARHEVTRRVVAEVEDVATAVALVRAGVGLAFLAPEHALGHGLVEVDLVERPPDFELGLARSTLRPLTAAARAFTEVITAPAG